MYGNLYPKPVPEMGIISYNSFIYNREVNIPIYNPDGNI